MVEKTAVKRGAKMVEEMAVTMDYDKAEMMVAS